MLVDCVLGHRVGVAFGVCGVVWVQARIQGRGDGGYSPSLDRFFS